MNSHVVKETVGTLDTLGPKNCVGMHVRVYSVPLFLSFFLLRLSEITVEQFIHTKDSHRMFKISATDTFF